MRFDLGQRFQCAGRQWSQLRYFLNGGDAVLRGVVSGDAIQFCHGIGIAFRQDACEADEVIREVASFRENYTELPMLYNSAVHRDLLDDQGEVLG